MSTMLFSAAERAAMVVGAVILGVLFLTLGKSSPSFAQWAALVVGLALIAAPLLAVGFAPPPRRPSRPFGE
jgi:cytochrome c biogenesis protein CcdA